MAIQKLIDNATVIDINRQAPFSTVRSRSGVLKYAKNIVNPYRFAVSVHQGLKYSENRELMPQIDHLDRIFEEKIQLNNNTGMNYLTAYLGDATTTDLANITVNSVSGANIYIDTTGCTSANASLTLFKKGDYIQPTGTVGVPFASLRSNVSPNSSIVTLDFGGNNKSLEEIIYGQIVKYGTVKVVMPDSGNITSADGWDTALGSNVYYLDFTSTSYQGVFKLYEDEALTTPYYPATPGDGSYTVSGTATLVFNNYYRYPYTVTEDVSYSADSNVTVKCHRGIIYQKDFFDIEREIAPAGGDLLVGNDVTFTTKFAVKPNYTLVNGQRVVIDDFELLEVIRVYDGIY